MDVVTELREPVQARAEMNAEDFGAGVPAQSAAEGQEEDDEFQRPRRVKFHDEQKQRIPILPVPTGMPPLPPKIQERRMYVTSADVRKYGGSEGCQACTQVYTWGRTNVPHSDACR